MNDSAPQGFDRERGPGGLELRSLPLVAAKIEARAAGDSAGPVIEGYGSVTDQPTAIGGMYSEWDEVVAPGAWAVSIDTADVRSMFNHDTNMVLGRTKSGTLRLSEDEYGLVYSVDINPDDPSAMSTHAKVLRGDVDGSSVWFRVVAEEWTYPNDVNGMDRPLRRILEGALMEVGPVTFPAFEATTSQARALAPLDAALRSRGMKDAIRAALAVDLLSDPDAAEAAIRELFAQAPELRDAACSCELPETITITSSAWRRSAAMRLDMLSKARPAP